MRLYLHGHEYKYAAEQMLLTMFPAERPEYPDGRPEGERLEISLNRGTERTTADRKSTRLNSSHVRTSRMPSSA